MIFKQYPQVLLSEKTLTTRVRLPAHIAAGKQWAIVPKRAAPAWWLDTGKEAITPPRKPCVIREHMDIYLWKQCGIPVDVCSAQELKRIANDIGIFQAKVRIDAFWQTELQRMTELEAIEEGVESVEAYSRLWNSINKAKGVRWEDNPQVWRIRFSVTKDVAEAVSRVGRAAIYAAFEGK